MGVRRARSNGNADADKTAMRIKEDTAHVRVARARRVVKLTSKQGLGNYPNSAARLRYVEE